MRRRLALTATSAALGALTLRVGSSNAQPSASTLRLVVPYAAGGVGDQLARAVAERIAVPLGQRVLVDNKPGGGTVIGTQAALVAPADGQTVLFVAASFVIQPQLAAKPVYDPVRDFTPVALMASNPHLLVVHPSVPATTLKELAAWAQMIFVPAVPSDADMHAKWSSTTSHGKASSSPACSARSPGPG